MRIKWLDLAADDLNEVKFTLPPGVISAPRSF
jgi:hypothetical protein